MDWSNEPYVKVYTRETDDDLALTWEARALWDALLKRLDRSGYVETRRGARGLAAITRIPLEVVTRVLPELLEDGRIVAVDGGFLAPNYIAAQESTKSDKLRQKDSRDRRRAAALDRGVTPRDGAVTFRDASITPRDSSVTDGHEASRNVTLCSADPDPLQTSALQSATPARAIPPSTEHLARDTWDAVAAARLQLAAELGLKQVLAMSDRFGTPSEPRAGRDLRERVREEGAAAAEACRQVVENLIAQARQENSVEWLSEKAFSAGGWQTARNWTPKQPNRGPRRTGDLIGSASPRTDHPVGDRLIPFGEL